MITGALILTVAQGGCLSALKAAPTITPATLIVPLSVADETRICVQQWSPAPYTCISARNLRLLLKNLRSVNRHLVLPDGHIS